MIYFLQDVSLVLILHLSTPLAFCAGKGPAHQGAPAGVLTTVTCSPAILSLVPGEMIMWGALFEPLLGQGPIYFWDLQQGMMTLQLRPQLSQPCNVSLPR